jgi:hypothetical protein|nr:MAG TPA: neurotoxin [Caudoviricetes sp.]
MIGDNERRKVLKTLRDNETRANKLGIFWIGSNGHAYVKRGGGAVQDYGIPDGHRFNSLKVAFNQINDPNPQPNANGGGGNGGNNGGAFRGGAYGYGYGSGGNGGGNGGGGSNNQLDQATIDSLNSSLAVIDRNRDIKRRRAELKRDKLRNEKQHEFDVETGKYNAKKNQVLQDYSSAKKDTDINTANSIDNLDSSISTLGMGGGDALKRLILDSANQAIRKANLTQAKNQQNLASVYNDYKATNANDRQKIEDQYNYDLGEANKDWARERQNVLYKKADIYRNAKREAERNANMTEGDSLNDTIKNAPFLDPKYQGKTNTMATPELESFAQKVATYDTSAISNNPGEQVGKIPTITLDNDDEGYGYKKKYLRKGYGEGGY